MMPILVQKFLSKRASCIAIHLITSWRVFEIQSDWIIGTFGFISVVVVDIQIDLILFGSCWDRLRDSRIH